MPIDVQAAVIASIPGLEQAEMIRPGYAEVEYDAVDARELDHRLEVRKLPGLFLSPRADQRYLGLRRGRRPGVDGGYQRGAHGAGSCACGDSTFRGYIGIMIDDLITKGTDEPYPYVHVAG